MGDLNLQVDGSRLLRVGPDTSTPLSIGRDAIAYLHPQWLISGYLGLHTTGRRTQYLIMNPYLDAGLFFTGDPCTQLLYFAITSYTIEPTLVLLNMDTDATRTLTVHDEGEVAMHEFADVSHIAVEAEAADARLGILADAAMTIHVSSAPDSSLHIAADATMRITIKPDEP